MYSDVEWWAPTVVSSHIYIHRAREWLLMPIKMEPLKLNAFPTFISIHRALSSVTWSDEDVSALKFGHASVWLSSLQCEFPCYSVRVLTRIIRIIGSVLYEFSYARRGIGLFHSSIDSFFPVWIFWCSISTLRPKLSTTICCIWSTMFWCICGWQPQKISSHTLYY